MERALDSAISFLTLEKIYPEAYSALAKSFEVSYEHMRKVGFKSDPYFKQNFSKVSERWGLLDAWLTLLLLATYAAGFAAGQRREKIKLQDILLTQKTICDKWPECTEMRIEGFLKSLSMLMEWYNVYTRKRK